MVIRVTLYIASAFIECMGRWTLSSVYNHNEQHVWYQHSEIHQQGGSTLPPELGLNDELGLSQ